MAKMNHTPVRRLAESSANRSRKRGGVLTLELILTMPTLLLVGIAVVQFSLMLMASQAVSASAYSGVRNAALPGSSALSVFNSVQEALDGWSFQNDVEVLVFVNGQPDLVEPLISATTGDKVTVTVRVNAARVAPNALSVIGISIANTELHHTYVMRKE